MSFYFALSLSPNSDLIREEAFLKEPNWEFRWFNLELIQRFDLRPQFLKFKLPLTQQGFQPIIFKQEKQEYLEFNLAFNRTL